MPSLNELFSHMRKRFPMYFGSYSLASLRAFLDGYFLCKKDYQIDLTPFEQKIKFFTNSIICENLEIENEFTTWNRKYSYDRDWKSWRTIDTTKEKEILEVFGKIWKYMLVNLYNLQKLSFTTTKAVGNSKNFNRLLLLYISYSNSENIKEKMPEQPLHIYL